MPAPIPATPSRRDSATPDRRLRVVGGGECRDLHNVSHASGACSCDGVMLQRHHVFKVVRQQEQRLGAFEGRAQRLWLAQISSDPCDTWHFSRLLQVARQRARRHPGLGQSPQQLAANQAGASSDENHLRAPHLVQNAEG